MKTIVALLIELTFTISGCAMVKEAETIEIETPEGVEEIRG